MTSGPTDRPGRPGRPAVIAWLSLLGVTFGIALILSLAGWLDQTNPPQGFALSDRLVDVAIDTHGDRVKVLLHTPEGENWVSPEAFIQAVGREQQNQASRGILYRVMDITSWTGLLWVAFGLSGQVMFTGRMVVQWIASERKKQSVVPVSFWWMSLIGASMLILYFIWRVEIVGILGQSTGWFIYARNLWMIHRPPGNPGPLGTPGNPPDA